MLPQSSPCLQLQPIPQSSQVRESVESNGQSGDGALAVQNVKGTGIGETPLSRTSSVDSGYEADKKDTGNNMPTAMEVRNSIMKARKSDRLQQAEKAEEAEKVECAGLVTKMKQVTTGAKELLSSRTNLDPSSSYGTFIQREVESEVDRVILLAEKASKAANSGDLKVAQALAKTAEDNLKLLAEKLPAIDSFMQEVDAFQQDIIGDFSKQKPDIEEAERHTYPLLYKRIMDMGEEFIDAAEALKQEGTVNLRVAEKRFETIKDSYEKAKKAKENEKGNYAEFVGKVKKIENKIKGIQPNSEEGWEIKDKANGYVWKALTEMHSCNLKVANLHVEQAEAHLK
ncbi:hypothetical protein, partial [Candidatus Regiella insecticola]|uniref:hypothetical protein n=1 Tax=Candidatus Regiella insecticola TaxID=138073 RepID=UPI000587FC24